MKTLLLLFTLFLFQGCSLNQLLLSKKRDKVNKVNKVNIVKYSSYIKEHRAYFAREGLSSVMGGKKYLFLYHKPDQHLYVLLHKKKTCLLYDLSVPKKAPITYTSLSPKALMRRLKKAGYTQPKNLERLGFIVHTGLRRYKGVKTLMVNVKDYRPLKHHYEEAIRLYDASKVSGVHTSLPKTMILSYFTKHYQKARTSKQKSALRKIAKKLKLGITEKPDEPDIIQPLFPYYLQQASLSELQHYLQSSQSSKALTDGERVLLEHRLETLKKKKLLEEASLEELITAYKQNQDPEFKKHILIRIKELQAQ